ncbi:MAG: class I tRNA ligase family protein [Candidatus Paceibacterota bacterium]|jgi:leucyl-tRNA synthetase
MKPYNHKAIEKKWQKEWAKKKLFKTEEKSKKPKCYVLDMFPYPSGAGLHVGHPKGYIATDIYARYKRMNGFNVLHPIGWDAFGLPAENYAIANKINPRIATAQNVKRYKKQIEIIGLSYDWSREIDTTDPAFYKWTQWAFIQMFKKGLAYESNEPVNWCPKDKTVLANEDVEDGKCERCGTPVEKKPMRQWVLKITNYADRLLEDLTALQWPEHIKDAQRNWIGRSEGAEIEFDIKSEDERTFYSFEGDSKPRNDKAYVERNVICAVVKHWSEDKYIGLKWKNPKNEYFWETFVTGGIEKGQTAEEAARAEVREETGFKNLKLIKKFDRVHSKFFHVPKDVNRYAHFDVFYFELENGDCEEVEANEKAKHDAVWLTKEQLENFALPASQRFVWNQITKGEEKNNKIKVFTTRPDTLFGVTYVVLSPEHSLVKKYIHSASNAEEIDLYIKSVKNKTEIERTAANKEKTGIELKGIKAINPTTGEKVPVWIADYVLADYGTGAVMAVPAHDERDWDFAKKYNLPIKEVIIPERIDKRNPPVVGKEKVERKNVQVIVRNPKNGKILCLQWKKHDWRTFPMGGIEQGESIIDAARREVVEETGYKNLTNGVVLGGQVRAEYFAAHKNINRVSFTNLVSFDLVDEERGEIAQEEKDEAEIFWADLKDLTVDFMTHAEMDIWLERIEKESKAYTGNGVLINSGKFTGANSQEVKKSITEFASGKMTVTYKLKDWVFSRQRYWGEPIPMIHCEKCGVVPVPEKDLPVKLPNVKSYEPTGTGESPLAAIKKWVNVKCPVCKSPAKRETNTMPQWAGSSWYYLRFIDPKNTKALVDKEKEKYWSPVDMYIGGTEHAARHLIYARFWHKFLFDIGAVNYSEPFARMGKSLGLIMGADGRKMSKRWGNVVNPDDMVSQYGADTLRVYEMFMGPFENAIAWNTESMIGSRRFLDRVWRLAERVSKKGEILPANKVLEAVLHGTIKKVTENIEEFSFNTSISAMMILLNTLEKEEKILRTWFEMFLKILTPFAPHITDELWNGLGNRKSISKELWPAFDPSKLSTGMVKIMIQINGKMRDELDIAESELDEKTVTEAVLKREKVQKWVGNSAPKKIIYVKGRVVNIVV